MLPLGQSDLPRVSTVDLFCPSCRDIYYPKASRHEGALACRCSCSPHTAHVRC